MSEHIHRVPVFIALYVLIACAPPAADSGEDAEFPRGGECPAERSFPGSIDAVGPDGPASLATLLSTFDGITGSVFLSDWPEEDLSAFEGIRCIDGRLDIHHSDALRSLHGLDQLVRATTIQLSNLTELTTLEGLGSLEAVEALLIYDYGAHSGLTSLDGLDRLRAVQYLSVSGPKALSRVDALEHITQLTDLSIFDLAGLTDLSGLGALEAVVNNVTIARNDSLADLAGWNALQWVGGDVWISNNPILPQALAEAWAAGIDEVGGDVRVDGNGP